VAVACHTVDGYGRLTAVAVLSPSTLSHINRTLEVLTHTATDKADSKLAGPVGALRLLDPPHTGGYATGIVVDAERRRIFAGDSYGGRVVVYDADSGLQVAEVRAGGRDQWGSAADVAVIDDVLVIASHPFACLYFRAIRTIPGLE
jgi:hypothetical protein